jgi:hypothetical protein
MRMVCPDCGKKLPEGEMLCVSCGTFGEPEDDKKKTRKSTLSKKHYDYLTNKFKDVIAVGYANVDGINIYDERTPPKELMRSRWIKESTSLVLKDGKPFLSVETMPSINTSPITVAGNILIHAIADSAIVRFKGRRSDVEYIFGDEKIKRYLLLVMPDPEEDSQTSKEIQMKLIEEYIKDLNFLEKSTFNNFIICFQSEFEDAIEELIR